MLSRQADRARLAYARGYASSFPRQFTLWGSTNDTEYLRDATGNRRFWPVKVSAINLEGIHRDRDQIWAEAACYEAKGESLELPNELSSLTQTRMKPTFRTLMPTNCVK
jgi:predicted P-loop ATPase